MQEKQLHEDVVSAEAWSTENEWDHGAVPPVKQSFRIPVSISQLWAGP